MSDRLTGGWRMSSVSPCLRMAAAFFGLVLLLPGCNGDDTAARRRQAAEETFSAVDDLQDTLSLASPAQRIVSLAPSNTELLFAMGLGDRLVGVTEFCNFPPEVDGIADVAGYSTLSVESIVAVKPDLVVASRGNDLEGLQTLRDLGIDVFALDISSLEQIFHAVERLDRLCRGGDGAAELTVALRQRVEAVRRRVARAAARPGVIWCYWGEPVFTAGAGTMIDDLIDVAGGRNVAVQAPGAWPQISVESVLSWKPQIIVTSYLPGGPENLEDELERLRDLEGWKALPAVISNRVHYIDGDIMSRPGPRSVDALEMLADLFHPALGD